MVFIEKFCVIFFFFVGILCDSWWGGFPGISTEKFYVIFFGGDFVGFSVGIFLRDCVGFL